MFSVIELRYLQGNRWMHKVVIGIIYFSVLFGRPLSNGERMLHKFTLGGEKRKRKQNVENERKTMEIMNAKGEKNMSACVLPAAADSIVYYPSRLLSRVGEGSQVASRIIDKIWSSWQCCFPTKAIPLIEINGEGKWKWVYPWAILVRLKALE